MKKIALLVMMGFSLLKTTAQDPNFSQFYSSPLTLNPALTGKFNGTFRVAGNYRNQWPEISQAFITSSLSLDLPILTNRISETDTWGVGVMAMTDKTANGILTANFFSVSTAYHKGLDPDGLNTIGVGFQGAWGGKRLDGYRLNFEEELQADGSWNGPSTEPVNNTMVTVNTFDFSTGVLYSGSTNGYNNFYFGTSVYHINRPKESFMGDGFYVLNPRVTINAGGYFPVSSTAVIHLSALHSRQAGAYNTVIGGAVALNVNDDMENNPTNVYLGTWVRFGDAIIPYVGLEFGEFRLGASYDVNMSSLAPASLHRGGIELSLIYIKRPPDGRPKIPCPKY
jgi:type IX secretion system PorP/SprF family membrane protein